MKISIETKRATLLYLVIALICVLGIMLQGCGWKRFDNFMESFGKSQGIIMSGIAHYVEADSTGKRAREANRIGTAGMLAVDEGIVTSYSELKDFFISKINWNTMFPEDRKALDDIFTAVAGNNMDSWLTEEEKADLMKQKIKVREFAVWLQTMSARYMK